ncbi:MAG: histidine kinase dimerization/phospho-acceptor domain-containing protein, partial [Aquabacterium sp.]
MDRKPVGLSLFWRTFVLLTMLLGAGIFAWVQTLRALETEPRAFEAASQTAGLVNLARAGLRHTDAIHRVALVKSLSGPGASVQVALREPADRWEPYENDRFSRLVAAEIRRQLGDESLLARRVNDVDGLWVGFTIERDHWWLHAKVDRMGVLANSTFFVWVGIALLATVLGSIGIARHINRPLQELSFAASRIRGGDLDSRLDENTLTSEIREVNRGFNRMARELARVEEDRAVMLAGISHDLRTPLARLRLETEMSVEDEEAKKAMANDIDQLDAIIDKFMDYARPGETQLRPVHLAQLIDREAAPFRDPKEIRI